MNWYTVHNVWCIHKIGMSLDDGEVISHNCSVVTLVRSDGLVWLKTAEVNSIRVVFMNNLHVGYTSFFARECSHSY